MLGLRDVTTVLQRDHASAKKIANGPKSSIFMFARTLFTFTVCLFEKTWLTITACVLYKLELGSLPVCITNLIYDHCLCVLQSWFTQTDCVFYLPDLQSLPGVFYNAGL